jgi:hypothetical protein
MKSRSLCYLLGCITGLIVTSGIVALFHAFFLPRPSDALPLSIIEDTGDIARQLAEILPGHRTLALMNREKPVACIGVKNGSIESLIVWTPDRASQVAIDSAHGAFPGSASFCRFLRPGRFDQPEISVLDDDLDGIPDRRMDWTSKSMSRLDKISWAPIDRQSAPAEGKQSERDEP